MISKRYVINQTNGCDLFNNTFNFMDIYKSRFFSLDNDILTLCSYTSPCQIYRNVFREERKTSFFYQQDYKVSLYLSLFCNVWDYLRIDWTKKEMVLLSGSSMLLENTMLPLVKKYLAGVLVREHFVEFLIKDWWYFHNFLLFLKKSSLFSVNLFSDLFGRETFYKTKNVILMYNCISEKTNTRYLFRVVLKDSFIMTSIMDIFTSACWVERECWDMLGVVFLGNKDLRRILTDYGFLGHPLRKEFPLTGFVEVRYNDSLKRIVFEPVEFAQEMRAFDFSNPWNQSITLSVSEGLMNFKTKGGGSIDFMGVLANTITKANLEANVLRNFKVRNVFASSNTTKEYLRNHNAIYTDLTSEFFFFTLLSLTNDFFFQKYNEVLILFKRHIFVFSLNERKEKFNNNNIMYYNNTFISNCFHPCSHIFYFFTFLALKMQNLRQLFWLTKFQVSEITTSIKSLSRNDAVVGFSLLFHTFNSGLYSNSCMKVDLIGDGFSKGLYNNLFE